MFSINDNKGFQITLSNGLKLSVQFGAGNYCENYNNSMLESMGKPQKSKDAEIAIIDTITGAWVTSEFIDCNDDVDGYYSPDMILDTLNKMKQFKRK